MLRGKPHGKLLWGPVRKIIAKKASIGERTLEKILVIARAAEEEPEKFGKVEIMERVALRSPELKDNMRAQTCKQP